MKWRLGTGLTVGYLIGMASWHFVMETPTVQIREVQVGDVPDLIRRLKPVTKERYIYTLGTDVQVCFEGDVSVSLKLNMKNNNEYTSKSRTLRGAVAGITSPSDEIKNALQGWGQ